MKLSRFVEGVVSGVDLVQKDFSLRFVANYGATPLQWLGKNGVAVVHNHPGEGAQLTWDSGQDPTPAGNIEPRSVTALSLQDDANSYYIREEAYVPDTETREALYQVAGTPPYFWISHEAADDAHPRDDRGDHGWSLLYHDILHLGPTVYQGGGVPIWFVPTAQVPSGILLIGDELKAIYPPGAAWYDRVCRTEGGHIAFTVRVSMADATPDSIAGVIFRRDIPLSPAANIDTVYSSPGCSLFVNALGGVDYFDGDRRMTLVANGATDIVAALKHPDGLKLEVRSFPHSNDLLILIHNRQLIRVTCAHRGPHTGLFAQGSGGKIKFLNRDFYDMGAKFRNVFESTARDTLLWTCSYHRQRLPFRNGLYRCNIPLVFTDPRIREAAWAHRLDGTKVSDGLWQSPFPLLSDFKSIYSGKADGSAGVHCLIHSVGGMSDAHFAAAASVGIHLNTLSEHANQEMVCGDSAVTITEWAPYWREDFLWECKE